MLCVFLQENLLKYTFYFILIIYSRKKREGYNINFTWHSTWKMYVCSVYVFLNKKFHWNPEIECKCEFYGDICDQYQRQQSEKDESTKSCNTE